MPVPARRLSKTRTRRRRSHADKRPLVSYAPCVKCRKPVLPHRACAHCGYYRGREVIDVLAKLTKKERKKREREQKQEEQMRKKEEKQQQE